MLPTNSIIDPAHLNLNPFTSSVMSQEIWASKYKWEDEQNFEESIERIVNGVFAKDQELPGLEAALLAKEYMSLGLLMPAGRIMAGAGTTKLVTLLNCFVNGTIQDDMHSIMDHVSYAVLTMQQGGGMGTDFSTIRPAGAILRRTGKGARASGPLPFMDMWNTAGITVESAGSRRGAQMGTLSDTHPDLPAFIAAKRTPGRLTNFNVSILVSDAFMEAIADDQEWMLYFPEEPIERDPSLVDLDFMDEETNEQQYVYSVWKARELWKLVTENTYEYSEPGVIYIDRVNSLNNLWYCEDIRCTNPCGEQPLPPHNACDLGHVNLARMVRNPFTEDAIFDFDLLRNVVRVLQRFLDNIWDVTNFPLELQREECLSKRRTGGGFTGLADALAQMGYRYGGAKSADLTERIMQTMCEAAYDASIDLAIEKGSFPLFDADKYLAPNTFAGSRLPTHIQERIRKHGIRNGVLLTLAPTGTSSIVYGNPQGGLEPFFSLQQKRKVLQPDGSHKEYVEYPYAVRLYREWYMQLNGFTSYTIEHEIDLPSYFTTMKTLSIEDHILIQSRCQRWVDASISKTINIPKEMEYEDFVRVYELAYNAGNKGCTTYRPSDVRGSILEDASDNAGIGKEPSSVHGNDADAKGMVSEGKLRDRPDVLQGSTYKIKWPRRNAALYLTVNADERGIPFEVFLTSKDASAGEWQTALSLMITAIYRKADGDISFVAEELQQIESVNDSAWMPIWNHPEGKRKNFGSLPAYIGYILEQHLLQAQEPEPEPFDVSKAYKNGESFKITLEDGTLIDMETQTVIGETGEKCPQCKTFNLHMQEGCKICSSCGYSQC